MAASFEERIKALEKAKQKIIHESFLKEQEKIENEMRESIRELKQKLEDKES